MIGSRPRNKIEGSSVTNMTRWLEGNRKEDNRTGKKKKIIIIMESLKKGNFLG